MSRGRELESETQRDNEWESLLDAERKNHSSSQRHSLALSHLQPSLTAARVAFARTVHLIPHFNQGVASTSDFNNFPRPDHGRIFDTKLKLSGAHTSEHRNNAFLHLRRSDHPPLLKPYAVAQQTSQGRKYNYKRRSGAGAGDQLFTVLLENEGWDSSRMVA
ncbi:hypothetical protein C8R47DRAFT_1073073 [Mycena vitilis]|nr:hypothetical protein C8R47DRAFT_1073073 [Mycena vitilis]